MRAARRPARLNGRRNQDLGGRQLDFRVTVVAPSECQDRDDQQHARQECRLDTGADPQTLMRTCNGAIRTHISRFPPFANNSTTSKSETPKNTAIRCRPRPPRPSRATSWLAPSTWIRSEEHTSELQSLRHL